MSSAAAAAVPKSSNASSQAARAALQQLLDDRRRVKRFGPPAQVRRGAVGEMFATAGDLAGGTGLPLMAIVATALVAVSAAGGYWLVSARTGRVSPGTMIAGKVLIDGKPLTQAALEFHAKPGSAGGAASTLRVETDHEGSFQRTAIVPSGTYAVVVKSGCIMPDPTAEIGRPVRIPAQYTSLASTPLAVEFRKEPSSFRIVLRR